MALGAVAASSTWNVLTAIAALVAAFGLVLAVAQLSFIRRENLKLKREELAVRVRENEVLRIQTHQQLETERVWVELLSRQLESQSVLALRPPTSKSAGSEVYSFATAIRARQLEFLARKRIQSVALADSRVESSPDDMSFASAAAALLGRNIAAREEDT